MQIQAEGRLNTITFTQHIGSHAQHIIPLAIKVTMKTIKINEEEYVLKVDVDKALKGSKVAPTKIQIVALQRGWIVIGRFSQVKEQCHLTSAFVIRSWGTTKGLGELAENGAQTNTKLDKCPDIHFHELTVIFRMDVDEKMWSQIE